MPRNPIQAAKFEALCDQVATLLAFRSQLDAPLSAKALLRALGLDSRHLRQVQRALARVRSRTAAQVRGMRIEVHDWRT